MPDDAAGQQAIEALDGQEADGRNLRVSKKLVLAKNVLRVKTTGKLQYFLTEGRIQQLIRG